MDYSLDELVTRFGGVVHGDGAVRVNGLAPLDSACAGQLAFLANPKYLAQVDDTRAGAVLIDAASLAALRRPQGRAYIVTPNPYAYFARVAQVFAATLEPATRAGVHPSAVVDASARVDPSAAIGPGVVVEAGAVVGAHARLDAHVYVGHASRIGAHAHLYPCVTVYRGCTLGERVIVHSGAVIGADGFGFARDSNEWIKIPQVGGVNVGDDVEIGANTTIDRGAMADTVIEHDVKIDNLVQIGHNCRIGAYTVIAGCVGIAGSTTIGRNCMLGGAVGVAGHVTLADGVVVTAQSGVSKSLTRAGVYTSAFPAIDNAHWNRNAAVMRNLDKMRDRVRHLEAAIEALKDK
jgi:UDP-3-O-[3-hydroxymyristoyl] glucosamine N-acyltransferase